MHLRAIFISVLALFLVSLLALSSANAQCCDSKGKKGTSELKADLQGKKEVKVMKETKDGAEVTRVTIKTVKDGKSEEVTLEGAEAEKYVAEMKDHECGDDDDCVVEEKDGKVKKVIKKKRTTKELR